MSLDADDVSNIFDIVTDLIGAIFKRGFNKFLFLFLFIAGLALYFAISMQSSKSNEEDFAISMQSSKPNEDDDAKVRAIIKNHNEAQIFTEKYMMICMDENVIAEVVCIEPIQEQAKEERGIEFEKTVTEYLTFRSYKPNPNYKEVSPGNIKVKAFAEEYMRICMKQNVSAEFICMKYILEQAKKQKGIEFGKEVSEYLIHRPYKINPNYKAESAVKFTLKLSGGNS